MAATDDADRVVELMMQGVKYAQASEACLSVIGFIPPLAEAIGRVADVDPDVTPELQAALEHVIACGEAMKRAAAFLQARFDVELGRNVDGG